MGHYWHLVLLRVSTPTVRIQHMWEYRCLMCNQFLLQLAMMSCMKAGEAWHAAAFTADLCVRLFRELHLFEVSCTGTHSVHKSLLKSA